MRLWPDVLPVGHNTILGDLSLGLLDRDAPSADLAMEEILQLIFHCGAPWLRVIALRPQVRSHVRAANPERNEVVHLVVALVSVNAVFAINERLELTGSVPNSPAVAGRADE